jgi:hypothetical protein
MQDQPVESVWIGAPNDGLALRAGERDTKGHPVRVEATLVTPGLEASETVYPHYATGFDDLVRFFAGLEKEWRGWAGTKTNRSPEDNLRLEARHDGHVWLQVQFWPIDADWSASATFRLDPGEQLSQIVANLRQSLSRRT